MGRRTGRTYWLAWQATLGGMADHGTRVRQRCDACAENTDIDVSEMLAFHGPDHSLVNFHPDCDRCGAPTNFYASPGKATPYLPLKD